MAESLRGSLGGQLLEPGEFLGCAYEKPFDPEVRRKHAAHGTHPRPQEGRAALCNSRRPER